MFVKGLLHNNSKFRGFMCHGSAESHVRSIMSRLLCGRIHSKSILAAAASSICAAEVSPSKYRNPSFSTTSANLESNCSFILKEIISCSCFVDCNQTQASREEEHALQNWKTGFIRQVNPVVFNKLLCNYNKVKASLLKQNLFSTQKASARAVSKLKAGGLRQLNPGVWDNSIQL